MVQSHIAANIKAEMARRNKTQADIAQLLGITRQGVSQRLLGRVDFRLNELQAIAQALNVSISDLIGTADRAEAAS